MSLIKMNKKSVFLAIVILLLIGYFSLRADFRSQGSITTKEVSVGELKESTIMSDGIERSYYYYNVSSSQTKKPLVLALHGGGGNVKGMVENYEANHAGINFGFAPWIDSAKIHGFVLIMPQGLEGSDSAPGWNDCRLRAQKPASDDVKFLSSLIDYAVTHYNVDPARVYVTGMSNGGFMTHRLLTEIPEKIAAGGIVIASHANETECVQASVPKPVLFMNGIEDPLVTWDGGEVGFSRGTNISTNAAVNFWVTLNKVSSQPKVISLPDVDTKDKSHIVVHSYGDTTKYPVVLYEVVGGGHVGPTLRDPLPSSIEVLVGKQNHDVEMSEEIWKFFEDKRLTI